MVTSLYLIIVIMRILKEIERNKANLSTDSSKSLDEKQSSVNHIVYRYVLLFENTFTRSKWVFFVSFFCLIKR